MTSVTAVHDRFPRGPVSDAKVVGAKPPFWWVTRAFIGIMAIAAIMLGWGAMRDSLIAQGFTQGERSAQTELHQLRDKLATTEAELKRKQSVLDAEIARKNALAVENTRLKGEQSQAVADLGLAMNKLKTIEAKKPPLPRNKRG